MCLAGIRSHISLALQPELLISAAIFKYFCPTLEIICFGDHLLFKQTLIERQCSMLAKGRAPGSHWVKFLPVTFVATPPHLKVSVLMSPVSLGDYEYYMVHV
jgi:hypothetical protein